MSFDSAVKRLQALAWLSPGSFLLFLVSMPIISVLPVGDYHLEFAVVEWLEMLAGTCVAVVVLAATFWRSRQAGADSTRSTKILAVIGLGLWAIFWVVAIAIHHGSG
jgi:hypothetical protein